MDAEPLKRKITSRIEIRALNANLTNRNTVLKFIKTLGLDNTTGNYRL